MIWAQVAASRVGICHGLPAGLTRTPSNGTPGISILGGLDLSPDPLPQWWICIQPAPLLLRLGLGLNLAPYARLISRQTDYEIHYVQLMIVVEQTRLPLRLAAAAFMRTPWDDGTCPRIAEMVLDAIPLAIHKSSILLTSGQVLYPFADAPHIANDGIILHGRSALQRALVHRAIHQSGCLPFPRCEIGVGQARPPEPGEVLAAFPFLQLRTLPAVPMLGENPVPTVPTVPPWLLPQSVLAPSLSQQGGSSSVAGPLQSSQSRVSSQLGVYALQALTEQDLAEGNDAPHAHLSREIETRARNVCTTAYHIQDILQRIHRTPPHLSIQPGANACWDLVNEINAILCALPHVNDTTGRHATSMDMT